MCQNSVLTSQLAFVPFSNKEFSLIRSLSFPTPGSVRASKLIMCAAISSGRNIVGFSWSWAVFLVFIFSYPRMYVLLTGGYDGVVLYKPASAASECSSEGRRKCSYPCHSSRTCTSCVLVGENFLQIIFNIVTS